MMRMTRALKSRRRRHDLQMCGRTRQRTARFRFPDYAPWLPTPNIPELKRRESCKRLMKERWKV